MNDRARSGRLANREEGRDRTLEAKVRGLEHQMASDIPLDAIDALPGSADVQTALEALAGVAAALAAGASYVDDAAAAAGGVDVGEFYRNGSVVMVRVA